MDKKAVLRLSERKFELILQTDVTEGVYVLASIPVVRFRAPNGFNRIKPFKFRPKIQHILSVFSNLTSFIHHMTKTDSFSANFGSCGSTFSFQTQSLVFNDLKVESKTNNIICLDVNLDLLNQGLKRCLHSSEVTMKLVKRDMPYLSIIAEQSTTQLITVTYDVPVELLSTDRLSQLREPGDYEPMIYTLMPPLRTLRPIIEHMKNIGPYLTIRGNMNGDLDFKVDAELISVATHFRNLEHPHIQGREAPQPDPSKEHTVKIDSSKFYKFLFSSAVNPQNVVLCLNVDNPVVIHVMHDDVYLTYYLPLVAGD
jgi:HUS1 checkpoint protein